MRCENLGPSRKFRVVSLAGVIVSAVSLHPRLREDPAAMSFAPRGVISIDAHCVTRWLQDFRAQGTEVNIQLYFSQIHPAITNAEPLSCAEATYLFRRVTFCSHTTHLFRRVRSFGHYRELTRGLRAQAAVDSVPILALCEFNILLMFSHGRYVIVCS